MFVASDEAVSGSVMQNDERMSPRTKTISSGPPGGGRISPRQGGPYKVENLAPTEPTPRGPVAALPASTRSDGGGAQAPALPRGYVVYVDTTRFVIDLASNDGVRPGSVVSVRRDKIAIVHPITGELLGELDEEVATGKVSEVRDNVAVAIDKSLKKRPYTTLALTLALGFLLGAIWAR